uniref:Uncharacterized protein n=1 Tax=Anguilla anguilla TaxID=7936 RepID=A0A0E9RTQ7_ANGAN
MTLFEAVCADFPIVGSSFHSDLVTFS